MEKKFDLDFPKNWKHYWLSVEDEKQLRDKLKIGDRVKMVVRSEDEEYGGEKRYRTSIVKTRVIEKYKHLVEVVSPGPKRTTLQYKDILMLQVQSVRGGMENV